MPCSACSLTSPSLCSPSLRIGADRLIRRNKTARRGRRQHCERHRRSSERALRDTPTQALILTAPLRLAESTGGPSS